MTFNTNKKMSENSSAFKGKIPQYYDACLGPVLFEPYAQDLADRLPPGPVTDVLELACGTGRLSKYLKKKLPKEVSLVCSDLNPDMLAIAQERLTGQVVEWKVVDMQAISFPDESFDLVMSQFGLMFPPDKARAIAEIFRVLRPGGVFLFNTWDKIKYNDVTNLANETIRLFFKDNPPAFYDTPFSLHDPALLRDGLEAAGFTDVKITLVRKKGIADSAALAAKGLVEGNPVHIAIMERDPNLVKVIEDAIEKSLTASLGDKPMMSPLQAWVFEAVKK